jgi:hypothetical protein
VLFTLLVFSSVGSFTSSNWHKSKTLPLALAVLCAMLAFYSVALQPILHRLLGVSTTLRIMVAVALLAPLGFLMGIPFPTGLRRAAAETNSLVSWAWAVNGGASVFGASMVMVISMTYGFSVSSLLGLIAYSIALVLVLLLMRSKATIDSTEFGGEADDRRLSEA